MKKLIRLFSFERVIIGMGIIIGIGMIVLFSQIESELKKEDKTFIQAVGETAKHFKTEFDKGYKTDSVQ